MYADIIIDISHEQLDKTFQYAIPPELEGILEIGSVVRVPFGKGNRQLTGYVISMTQEPSYDVNRIKFIEGIADKRVNAATDMIKLAFWLKTHYGCTMNQALKTVIPVKDKINQKVKRAVCLNIDEDKARELLLIYKKKAKAKHRLLEALIEEPVIDSEIVRSKLNISSSTVKAMEEDKVIIVKTEEYYRNPVSDKKVFGKDVVLNEEQRAAVQNIIADYNNRIYKTYLIHGVTGSGKTEVYMDVIEHVIASGRQVIMLIPEIALTFQTVQRFYHRFGDKVSIINSRMSKGERYDQFLRALKGEVSIMIGPRSALFTQFPNLGLIVIDEEHEGAYRSEQLPRYHAVETAIHIAKEHNASVILGSATPSIDSFYRAKNGEFKLLTLKNRAGKSELPQVYISDMRKELKSGNRTIFSLKLQELIRDRLDKKEQIMLFLNKRGTAGFVSCRACGYVCKCPHCDVSMTAHRNGRLVCHYCGYETPQVKICPECGSRYISGFKAGTEAVEDAVHKMFPDATVLRMDLDTTKGKDGHEHILNAFATQQADVLVGTQMIVKGHDFPKVTLVGIVAADMSLYSGDYRAVERTFQLVTQAAGRAGRGVRRGEVVIQTYSPDNYGIICAASQDYTGFYDKEIAYRKMLSYPPVSNMIKINISSEDENKLLKAAENIKQLLEKKTAGLSDNIKLLGPSNAPIYKISDVYTKIIYLRSADFSRLSYLMDCIDKYTQDNDMFKNISIQYDVN